MTGRIHSVQSLGAVDGPGLRYVVFMQGCPLRCAYCHNPDTWPFDGGEEMDADRLVTQILRYRPYFGENGGVTVSGGEPLSQAGFVEELFAKLHRHGIHTALDTSGIGEPTAAARVLQHTDLVLADLKFLDTANYLKYCRADFHVVERFLALTAQLNVPLWIRHVVVPGVTDGLDHLRAVQEKAQSYPNLQKIEWLPFHTLCLEKYERMGLIFPLAGTPPMEQARLDALLLQIQQN